MSHFKDKVAIATGGASGIGRALCEELGRREAVVLVTDINVEGAKEVASDITAIGGVAYGTHLDVTQAEDVQRIIEETASDDDGLLHDQARCDRALDFVTG